MLQIVQQLSLAPTAISSFYHSKQDLYFIMSKSLVVSKDMFKMGRGVLATSLYIPQICC